MAFTNMGKIQEGNLQGEGRKQEIYCGHIEFLMLLNTHRPPSLDI